MTALLAGIALITLGGAAATLAGRRSRLASGLALAGIVPGSLVGAAGAAGGLLAGGGETLRVPSSLPFGELLLRLDPLGALFLLVLFTVAPLAALFGGGYLREVGAHRRLGGVWLFYAVLVAGMAVVLLAADAVLFLIAWEVMSLASFFLVTFEDERSECREAGWTYLVATHIGTAVLLGFFLVAGSSAGRLDFAAMRGTLAAGGAAHTVAFLLAVVGFGTKAGFMPLHVWLPEAHPAAPSHVSAVMSGVMIKTGIYGLLRVLIAPGPAAGLVGLDAGRRRRGLGRPRRALRPGPARPQAAAGLPQRREHRHHRARPRPRRARLRDRERRRSRSSASPAGCCTWSTTRSSRACCSSAPGSVVHATGTREIDRLGGLLKRMPLTGRDVPGRRGGDLRAAAAERVRQRVPDLLAALAYGDHRPRPRGAARPSPCIGALALIGGLARPASPRRSASSSSASRGASRPATRTRRRAR